VARILLGVCPTLVGGACVFTPAALDRGTLTIKPVHSCTRQYNSSCFRAGGEWNPEWVGGSARARCWVLKLRSPSPWWGCRGRVSVRTSAGHLLGGRSALPPVC
jgi:hypothetical protein